MPPEVHPQEPSSQLSPDAKNFFSPAKSTPPDTNIPDHPSHSDAWHGFAETTNLLLQAAVNGAS